MCIRDRYQRRVHGKEEEEKEKKEKEKVRRKEEFDEFNKKKIEAYSEKFKAKEDQRKQKEKEAEEQVERDKETKVKYKEKREKKIEEAKEFREKERQNNEDIKNLHESSEMQEFYNTVDRKIQFLFRYYIANTYMPIDLPHSDELLYYQAFMSFVNQFNIIPSILRVDEAGQIYKSLTKNKPIIDKVPAGMTYDEFRQALLRIAIKGRKTFDAVADRVAKLGDENVGDQEMAEIAKENQAERDENEDKENDNYYKIDATTVKTTKGLMYYLDLPEDKKGMITRVQALRKENFHNVPPKKKPRTKLC
eukprot:TRINITY_DN9340_c0_g2_i2.p1 TRINITY_DN9340_c0_g2~~TRINITY_DN9340_c0_g2_i2.p1  ORF type:complete len:306 (+),score=135.23 TRINITY_DN9340_c0_g2_i2:66-983(+)